MAERDERADFTVVIAALVKEFDRARENGKRALGVFAKSSQAVEQCAIGGVA